MRKPARIILATIFLLTTGCTSLFFYPEKGLRDNPAVSKLPHEDIHFKTPDGLTLHGWFFTGQAPDHRQAKSLGTVLFLHGNAENISTHVGSVLWLVRTGFDVFVFDYRGYGMSEGTVSIDGVHVDAAAALDTVMNLPKADRENIFVFGQSLGGAIATYSVATSPRKDSIRALIIDSAFSGYRTIAREKLSGIFFTWPFQYPASFLFDDSYSPDRWIGRVPPVPVLIMHGDSDDIVPAHHGEILYQKASGQKELWMAKGRGHIGALDDDELRKRLVEYMKKLRR